MRTGLSLLWAAGVMVCVGIGAWGMESSLWAEMPQASGAASAEGEGLLSVPRTRAEWLRRLSPEAYRVARQKGTEPAFSGEYWNTKTPGTYRCRGCGQPLFSSQTKYDSGTGWPSFWAPLNQQAIRTALDRGWFTTRTEVLCRRCGSHLGHVFDDGPPPTGLRYCLNSLVLKLDPEPSGK